LIAKNKFKKSTLPEFLQKTVKHFDKLADVEKKPPIFPNSAAFISDGRAESALY
jgi:hypothetical protein